MQTGSDSLKPLRSFCQVARLGSVSRAAQVLGISQPAVSLQLQQLEVQLGREVFDRSAKQISLNAAGEALFELARTVLAGFDGLSAQLDIRLQRARRRQLSLGADICGLALLRATADSETFHLHDSHADIQQSLAQSELDCWLGLRPSPRAAFGFDLIARSSWQVVLCEGHALGGKDHCSLNNLQGQTRIGLGVEHTLTRAFESAVAPISLPLNAAEEASDIAWLLSLVRRRQAYCVLPEILITQQALDGLLVRPLDSRVGPAELGLSYLAAQTDSEQLADLVALLSNAAQTLSQLNRL